MSVDMDCANSLLTGFNFSEWLPFTTCLCTWTVPNLSYVDWEKGHSSHPCEYSSRPGCSCWIMSWSSSCLGLCSSLLSFSCVLFILLCFSVFVISLCCLLLASSMAESSCCFWICSRNLVHRLVSSLAFMHCRELMKSVWKLCFSIIHATVDGPWTGVSIALLFILL